MNDNKLKQQDKISIQFRYKHNKIMKKLTGILNRVALHQLFDVCQKLIAIQVVVKLICDSIQTNCINHWV